MTMQRRHFEMIANSVRMLYGDLTKAQRQLVAERFADDLTRTNPNFNRARFLKACGVEESN